MQRTFAITAAGEAPALRPGLIARIPFTVTNTSGRPLRARAELKDSDGGATPRWCRLAADPRHDFETAETAQIVVEVEFGAGSAPGDHGFRLDVVDIDKPEESFSRGPVTSCRLLAAESPARGFPGWVAAAAMAAVLLAAGLFWALSGAGEPELLPDVIGQPGDEAVQLLRSLGVVPQLVQRASAEHEPGRVIEQFPIAGGAVVQDSTVELVLAIEGRLVPGVIGKKEDDAVARLQQAGFEIVPTYVPTNDRQLHGQVISQLPVGDVLAKPGSKVRLVVLTPQVRRPGPPSRQDPQRAQNPQDPEG